MSELISDIGAYLKAVFVDGVQKIFTFFDAFGIVIYFFPKLSEWLSLNESLVRGVGGAIVLISFLLANFSLYRKLEKKTLLRFEIIKVQSVGVAGDLLSFNQEQASIADTFDVHVQALINISNSGPVTSVSVFVSSVEPNCLKQGISPRDIEVFLLHQVSPNHPAEELENPYYLKADEMRNIQLKFKIPFCAALVEEKCGSLSSLTKMSITIGVRPTGQESIYRSMLGDLTPTHRRIEGQIATKIQHLQNTRLASTQVLDVLKRYWGVPR